MHALKCRRRKAAPVGRGLRRVLATRCPQDNALARIALVTVSRQAREDRAKVQHGLARDFADVNVADYLSPFFKDSLLFLGGMIAPRGLWPAEFFGGVRLPCFADRRRGRSRGLLGRQVAAVVVREPRLCGVIPFGTQGYGEAPRAACPSPH